MGEILVARGKATKECRPGNERIKENRPRKKIFQDKILFRTELKSFKIAVKWEKPKSAVKSKF